LRVDGGNSIALSPVYPVAEASDVSVWYFHGQSDAGGDPSGDRDHHHGPGRRQRPLPRPGLRRQPGETRRIGVGIEPDGLRWAEP